MKVWAIVAGLLGASVVRTEGFLDMEAMKEQLDMELPSQFHKYVKRGKPFLTMVKAKLLTDECKEKWTGVYDEVLEKSQNSMTARGLLEAFCSIGDDCFAESIEAGTKFLDSNPTMKSLAENALEQSSLSLDVVTAGAPMLYLGLCENVLEKEEL